MRVATEVEHLAQQLVMFEVRAAGLRPIRAPIDGGSELRLVEQQHGALLFEWAKAAVRARLEGRGTTEALRAGAGPSWEPLATRRARVQGAVRQQCAVWAADTAAGRALPPAHDAVTVATALFEGA